MENIDNSRMKLLTTHPFLKNKMQTSAIMLYMIISLLPMVGFAMYKYRMNAVIHFLVIMIVCVGTEYLYEFFLKKEITVTDGNAVLIGMLIFLMMPAYVPYWVGVLGSVIAIIIVKHLLRKICNIYVNPACFAICVLNIILAGYMDNYTTDKIADIAYESLHNNKAVDTFNLMIGNTDGAMGEICVIAMLTGALLLILTGVVDIYVPSVSIICFCIVVMMFKGKGFDLTYLTAQLGCGGFLFAIWFIASDCAASPITIKGQVIYGIIIGILTGLSRVLFSNDRIIYFVILVCSLFVPLIENLTIPKPLFSTKSKGLL